MEQRLKEAVERIVRPIPLREGVKDGIREELWSHLHQSYESLRAEGLSEEAAYEEAVSRLGDPEAIRKPLFRSQSLFNRWMGRINPYSSTKPGEWSTWRGLVLAALAFALESLFCSLLLLGGGNHVRSDFANSVEICLMWTGFAALTFPMHNILHRAISRASTAAQRKRIHVKFLVSMVVACVLWAAFSWLAGYALLLAIGGAAHDDLHLYNGYVCALNCTIWAPLVGILLGRNLISDRTRRKQLHDWPYEKPLVD